MIECSINSLVKYYGATKVFENISFELYTNEKVGLIGPNGSGKTTLMKTIMGMEDHHEGTISFKKGNKVGYLDQIFNCSDDTTVMDILQRPFENIFLLKNKIKIIEENLKKLEGSDLESEMKSYGLIMEEFELGDGYIVETNINKICNGLFIPNSFREKKFQMLSGGEKTRVLLAKLLLENPDILLLDEPTNHLDIKSIEWLEGFLADYKGTVLMVSHDRVFLDKVVTRILDLKADTIDSYDGNYSQYVVEKEKRFEIEYRAYLNNQRKIEMMERQIERYRIWGAMRDSEVMYKRAKELEKRLDKVEVVDKPNIDLAKIKMNIDNVNRSGKIVMHIENLKRSFADKKLFSNLDLTVFYQDRLCIMGENGSGKSTLLNIILDNLPADDGTIKLGANVKIGYLPQNVTFENEDISILDYYSEKHRLTHSESRNELAKMLFIRDDVYKKIKSLSGGEKSRLKLSSLIFDKVNLMILDEPTNHLDIDSREVLEETLLNFNGTIIFVSHDRYFVQKIASKILILDKHRIKLYPMNYDDYMEYTKREVIEEPVIAEVKKTKASPVEKAQRKTVNTFKLAKVEKEIEEMETRLSEIEEEMVTYSHDPGKLMDLFKEKDQLTLKLAESYDLWEEIQS